MVGVNKMIELTCAWCNVDNDRVDICDFEEGANLWECSDCGKENLIYGEVDFRLRNVGKYIPASPSYCPNPICKVNLSKFIDIDTATCCMLCPSCLEPVVIKVERIEK
jgi:hypothetical protein